LSFANQRLSFCFDTLEYLFCKSNGGRRLNYSRCCAEAGGYLLTGDRILPWFTTGNGRKTGRASPPGRDILSLRRLKRKHPPSVGVYRGIDVF